MKKPTYKELERRISQASDFLAAAAGAPDDRDWTYQNIDSAVRALQGPNYERFVTEAKTGKYGPNTYAWHAGEQ